MAKFKSYSGNKGGYNPKRADAVINGEIFSFEIQIKRKDRKISLKEISDNRTIYSNITESVWENTKDEIKLLKSHLIYDFLMKLETGFDRSDNQIDGKKGKDNANDIEFKKTA